jgi:hypothetical protein
MYPNGIFFLVWKLSFWTIDCKSDRNLRETCLSAIGRRGGCEEVARGGGGVDADSCFPLLTCSGSGFSRDRFADDVLNLLGKCLVTAAKLNLNGNSLCRRFSDFDRPLLDNWALILQYRV